jgi:hypothetical protein
MMAYEKILSLDPSTIKAHVISPPQRTMNFFCMLKLDFLYLCHPKIIIIITLASFKCQRNSDKKKIEKKKVPCKLWNII